jgi:hypothetical protein
MFQQYGDCGIPCLALGCTEAICGAVSGSNALDRLEGPLVAFDVASAGDLRHVGAPPCDLGREA